MRDDWGRVRTLWKTLFLGGKTFSIIEAFFFFWFWFLAPLNHLRHLESIQYIFPYIKDLPQRSRTPLTRKLSTENSPPLYARGKLSTAEGKLLFARLAKFSKCHGSPSLRSADVFPVVASLPPTGNTSALRSLGKSYTWTSPLQLQGPQCIGSQKINSRYREN